MLQYLRAQLLRRVLNCSIPRKFNIIAEIQYRFVGRVVFQNRIRGKLQKGKVVMSKPQMPQSIDKKPGDPAI
jgi:hypothetical protein